MRIVVASALMGFCTVASANETCGLQSATYDVIFVDRFGGADAIDLGPPVELVASPQLGVIPTVSIQQPLANAAVAGDFVDVVGSFTGPAGMGVAVNGQRAYRLGNQFFAPRVPVPVNGELVATATTIERLTATTLRTVAPGTTSTRIRYAAPVLIAPARARLQLALAPNESVQSITIDFDGDGNVDLNTQDPDATLAFDFLVPGIYQSRVVMTTTALTQEYRIRVAALDVADLRRAACVAFAHLKARLTANDTLGALDAMHPSMNPRFKALFEAFGNNRPIAATRLGTIASGLVSPDEADMTLVRVRPTRIDGYQMHLSLGNDGVWRIDGM